MVLGLSEPLLAARAPERSDGRSCGECVLPAPTWCEVRPRPGATNTGARTATWWARACGGTGRPTHADVRAVGKFSMGTKPPALTPGPCLGVHGASGGGRVHSRHRRAGRRADPPDRTRRRPLATTEPLRVLVLDDDPRVRDGRRRLLEVRPGSRSSLSGRRRRRFGAVDAPDGSAAAARVRGLAGGAPVIALSLDGAARTAALAAGARAFVEKDGAADSWSPPCTPSHPGGAPDDDHAAAPGRDRPRLVRLQAAPRRPAPRSWRRGLDGRSPLRPATACSSTPTPGTTAHRRSGHRRPGGPGDGHGPAAAGCTRRRRA